MTTTEQKDHGLEMSRIYEAQRAARDAADRVLHEFWNEDLYPIDPFRIAEAMGATVYSGDLPGDVSGMLRGANGAVEIYVDTDDSFRRQRFTAAHELGHLVQRLDRGELATDLAFIDRRGELAGRGTDPDEVFANEFAACLLMPAALVRVLSHDFQPWELAKFFDVSPSAMSIRLRNLGLES